MFCDEVNTKIVPRPVSFCVGGYAGSDVRVQNISRKGGCT